MLNINTERERKRKRETERGREREINKNEKVHKEQRMPKTPKIRRVIIRDNKSCCQVILQNLIETSIEVYKLKPFKNVVKFNFGGQRSCFERAA